MKRYNSRLELHALENVKGTGQSTRDGDELIVFVTKKVAESDLDPADIVPPELEIAGRRYRTDVRPVGIPHLGARIRITGTNTDIDTDPETEAAGETEPADHRRRHSPTPGGVSLGNRRIGAGTLGSPRLEDEDGDPVVLTNAHVTAGAREQYHPAFIDSNDSVRIGELKEESPLEGKDVYTTDSALVRVDDSATTDAVTVTDQILGLGRLVDLDPWTPSNATVVKAGRTTGVTEGELIATNVLIDIAYGEKTLRYSGIEAFTRMSGPGDSGSLICYEAPDGDGVIGSSLLYAGSDQATFGIPLSAVMDEHGELTVPIEDDSDDSDDSDDLEELDDLPDELIEKLIEDLREILDRLQRVLSLGGPRDST